MMTRSHDAGEDLSEVSGTWRELLPVGQCLTSRVLYDHDTQDEDRQPLRFGPEFVDGTPPIRTKAARHARVVDYSCTKDRSAGEPSVDEDTRAAGCAAERVGCFASVAATTWQSVCATLLANRRERRG